MHEIQILGAGPAGSAAAIAALSASVPARIFERSSGRRHKVCGEFITPEACGVLADLGVWDEFLALRPARIRRCMLHFGRTTKTWKLPECAFGLSRYELDGLLLRRAETLGALVVRGEGDAPNEAGKPVVVASGRSTPAPKGNRIFGFKTHYTGPTDDHVELFFFRGGYIGVSAAENGITNVCGLAPEGALRACGFRLDEFVARQEPVAERLRPLARAMEWLTVGPLVFSNRIGPPAAPDIYPAGDALGFIDPFTGSGILNAMLTGRMAGSAAARRIPSQEYVARCRGLLEKPYRASVLIRAALKFDGVGYLAALVPGRWLFRSTRIGRWAI